MIQDLSCTNCEIRAIACFADLMQEDLDELDRNKISTIYRKGQIIFHEGMHPTGLYCLNKGKIKISKHGVDGKEQIVRFVLEGGLLGVRSLLG